MTNLWRFMGRVGFWAAWPLLFVYLFGSKRTRILVICGHEILVTKRWLGSGRWNLPGGGLHSGEPPASGAARELAEETGISVTATELQYLLSGRAQSEQGLRFTQYGYVLVLAKKPHATKQRFELTHLEWMNWQKLYDDPRTSSNIRSLIDVWQNSL